MRPTSAVSGSGQTVVGHIGADTSRLSHRLVPGRGNAVRKTVRHWWPPRALVPRPGAHHVDIPGAEALVEGRRGTGRRATSSRPWSVSSLSPLFLVSSLDLHVRALQLR